MEAAAIIAGVVQIVQAGVVLAPAVLRAIKDYEALFADGNAPTEADLEAILSRIRTQSDAIQSQPD